MLTEEYKKLLKENYTKIRNSIIEAAQSNYRNAGDITIIAVSKSFPAETIELAFQAGIRSFGENYAQEFRDKIKYFSNLQLKPDWHFIGHLQSNKVKYLIPYVKLIHTVDELDLAREIDKRANSAGILQNILLQVNTSGEPQKSGVNPEGLKQLVESILPLKNLNLIGLMTIGTFTDEESISRKEFSLLAKLKNEINNFLGTEKLTELSMGMSHDYLIAIEEGATIVRIGTAIFGNRIYSK